MDEHEIDVAVAALDVLAEAGAVTSSEWANLLVERGFGYVGDMFDLVESIDSPLLGFLPDMRNVMLDALLDGRVLTHRVTSAEISADILSSFADFGPLLSLFGAVEHPGMTDRIFRGLVDEDAFIGRGVDDPSWPELEGLLLPEGSLQRYRDGDLIALSLRGCTLSLEPVAEVGPRPNLIARLGEIVPDGEMFILDSVVWQLMYDDPDLFHQPVAPIGELFVDAGIVRVGEYVARQGVDIEARLMQQRVSAVSRSHDLDDDGARALIWFVDAVRSGSGGDASPEVLLALADPDVASESMRALKTMFDKPESLRAVADSLLSNGTRRVAAAAHWFRAKAFGLLGEPVESEQALERALTVDPYFEPALLDLAQCASVRGDATRGLSLLRRIESDAGDELEDLLLPFETQEHPELGRNDKCWCGSGRKYKVCHLNKTDFPLEQRVPWLYNKACDWAIDSSDASLIMDLAYVRSQHWGDDEASLRRAFDDPFASDVALFEGGLFAEFVALRGALLPADELMLAQQWLLIERSLFEVESVTVGEGLALRDVRTGDRQDVSERSASTQLKPGHLICVRVVPVDADGSSFQIFGGIETVYPSQVEDLMTLLDEDPRDPEELVALLSARFAPPRVQTRQGDPIVRCEGRFELGQLDGIKRTLGQKYGAAHGNEWTWTEDGSVFGELTLAGSQLVVKAMSEKRFDTLLDTVRSLDPAAELVSEIRTPWVPGTSADSSPAPRSDVTDNPEVVAFMEEHIREYEEEWIDTSIPALHGDTPLEAAADPTRREDLIRLLDSMPHEERPGAMSARRLRKLLGLS